MQIHHNGTLVEERKSKITFVEGKYYSSNNGPITTTLDPQEQTLHSTQLPDGDGSNVVSQSELGPNSVTLERRIMAIRGTN